MLAGAVLCCASQTEVHTAQHFTVLMAAERVIPVIGVEPTGAELALELHNLIEANDCAGIIRLHRSHGGITRACFKDIQPADNPFGNVGGPIHWAVWYRHFDAVRLLAALGAATNAAGSAGPWIGGRTPMEYAAHLDSKAGHPYFEHVAQLRKALEAVERGDLSTIKPDTAIPAGADVAANDVLAAVMDMVDNNAVDVLCQSLTNNPGLVNARLLGDYGNKAPIGHYAIYACHWDVFRVWLEHGGDPTLRGEGGGWVSKGDCLEYARFLDSKGHEYYAFERHVTDLIAAHKAAAEEPREVGEEAKDHNDGGGGGAVAECVVCLEASACRVLVPCHHMCVCADCAEPIVAAGRCPLCRGAITTFV